MRKLLIILLFVPLIFFGQNKKNDTIHQTQNIKFNYKSVIIPSAFIGYGIIGIDNGALKRFNYEIQQELIAQQHNEIKIDDVSQYVPSLAVYAVSYTHLRAHETVLDLVCRLLLEKKKKK